MSEVNASKISERSLSDDVASAHCLCVGRGTVVHRSTMVLNTGIFVGEDFGPVSSRSGSHIYDRMEGSDRSVRVWFVSANIILLKTSVKTWIGGWVFSSFQIVLMSGYFPSEALLSAERPKAEANSSHLISHMTLFPLSFWDSISRSPSGPRFSSRVISGK